MNLYTDEISKLAILAKLPVPKKATLNKIICKAKCICKRYTRTSSRGLGTLELVR